MDERPIPGLRRRNGRLQACDACRLRKLRCDHRQPCNRCCKRRGEAAGCSYTVSTSPSSLPSPPRVVPTVRRNAGGRPLQAGVALSPPTPFGTSSSASGTSIKPGYLGFTSYSAVYEETRDSLSLLGASSQALRGPDEERNAIDRQQHSGSKDAALPEDIQRVSLALLQQIPKEDQIGIHLIPRDNLKYSWVHAVAKEILGTLYPTWSASLAAVGDQRDPAKLQEMAKTICTNTTKPFDQDSDDPRVWLDQFSGINIRWEALGLLFLLWDKRLDGPLDQQTSKNCIDLCIQLSRQLGEPNVLILFLLYRRSKDESLIHGDASLAAWETHAQIVALAVFLGLHDEVPIVSVRGQCDDISSRKRLPTLASEFRRRLFWSIFSSDKSLVAFTGRPPLLSRRYVTTPLPQDITEDELLAGPEVVAKVVETGLDERGWRIVDQSAMSRDSLANSTYCVARLIIAKMRDEIWEFALSPVTDATSVQRLQELKARATCIMDQLPPQIAYGPADPNDSELQPRIVWARLTLQLDRLFHLFSIERILLLRHPGFGSADELLSISLDMVALTLKIWTHREKFVRMRWDFEWILMAYGAPAGGILCIELLRPARIRQSSSHVSRSAIIQNLSLLVGFLDWVQPSAPNSNLCANVKATIQYVLDHAINNSSVIPEKQTDVSDLLNVFDWGSEMPPSFNLDLLDTYDWFRPDIAD